MKKVPLLALLVPLMVGIILAEYVGWDILVPSLLASALLLLAAIGSMWLRDDKGLLFVVLLGCSFVSLGYALRLLQQPERSESHYVHYIPQPTEGFAPRTTAVLLLRDAPFEKGASARAVAEVLQVGYPAGNQIRWFDTEGKVQLFFPRGHQEVTTLQRGDTLLAQVPFRQPAAADSGHTFDYRRYLSRKGILRTAYLTPDNFIAIPSSQETFMRRADRGRFHLLDLLRKSGLETTEQSLASALLLGWGNDMEEEIKQQFRDAGITHLLCVSGLTRRHCGNAYRMDALLDAGSPSLALASGITPNVRTVGICVAHRNGAFYMQGCHNVQFYHSRADTFLSFLNFGFGSSLSVSDATYSSYVAI